jgi:hypothetical protein
MIYLPKYKYNGKVYDTEDEMIALFGDLSPISIEYDYEELIKYYLYDNIEKVDDDEC